MVDNLCFVFKKNNVLQTNPQCGKMWIPVAWRATTFCVWILLSLSSDTCRIRKQRWNGQEQVCQEYCPCRNSSCSKATVKSICVSSLPLWVSSVKRFRWLLTSLTFDICFLLKSIKWQTRTIKRKVSVMRTNDICNFEFWKKQTKLIFLIVWLEFDTRKDKSFKWRVAWNWSKWFVKGQFRNGICHRWIRELARKYVEMHFTSYVRLQKRTGSGTVDQPHKPT